MDVIRCRACSAPLLSTASFCGTCGDTISSEDNPPDSPTMHGSSVSGEQYATVPAASVPPMSREPGLTALADGQASANEDARDEYATISTDAPVDTDAIGPGEVEIANRSTTLLNAFTEEQDTIAAQTTVHLKEERDETDFLPLIPLPGQFAAAPAPERADHRQPEMQRAEHLQASNDLRGQHFQPAMLVRAQHRQPGGAASRQKNILIGGVGALIVAAVITISLLPIFHPPAATGPRLALVNATSAFPGGSVQLHGTNFTSGAAVSITLDGIPQAAALPNVQTRMGLGIAFLLAQNVPSDPIVQKDGTFDATITIPSAWQVNTTHDIEAIEQGSGQKALTKVTVMDRAVAPSLPTSQLTPGVTPGATPVQKPITGPIPTTPATQGPPPPTSTSVAVATLTPVCIKIDNAAITFNAAVGGAAPATQAFTISNGPGCSAGNWALTADSTWLTADQNKGTIAANGSTKVNVGISTANLKVGTYTGHIHLSPGTNTITVTLHIQLLPTCLTATTGILNFSALAGGTAPAQTATIANGATCSAGTWSVASDAAWLLVNGGGQIATGGSANATVNISTTGLAAGNRTGHLTFSASGSNPATVTVNLTIQVPPCITADQRALSFSGDVGSSPRNPGPQRIIVTNCGPAGTITAATGGAGWLTVTGGGQVGAGAQTVFTAQALCLNPATGSLLLPAVANTYTTTVTFTITAADGTKANYPVTVTFNVTRSVIG